MMDYWHVWFQSHVMVLVVACGILGLLIGSFLNVVIYRLPVMLEHSWRHECLAFLGNEVSQADGNTPRFNLNVPASHCPACKKPLKPWHNIPVISYVLLKGQCHYCAEPINRRYPLVELVTGLVFAVLGYHFGFSGVLVAYMVLAAGLLVLGIIDFDTQLLPDCITLPLLWLGLLFNLWSGRVSLEAAVLGAVAGYVALWSVFWLFKLITGKEGMGYGDFKLLAALGAWLGWMMLPLVILLSSFVGAVVGIVLMRTSRLQRGQPIPFGPYLVIAGMVALLWGQDILAWYWHGF